MNLDIEIEDDAWLGIPDLRILAERAAQATLAGDARGVTVLFSNDAAVREMNRQWRGKNAATNVLSFPSPAQPLPPGEIAPLGDIVLAHETVAREAQEQGKLTEHHTAHLIVHGMLHLLGYDHMAEDEAEAMETKERQILASLGIADPYQT